MATKIHHIQPLPGVKDLWSLLDLIRSEPHFSSHLAEMESVRKEANDAVELIAPASEIVALREQAGVLHEQAKLALENAIAKAAQIIADAEAAAEKIEGFAKTKESDVERRAVEFYKSVDQKNAEFLQRETEIQQTNASLKRREDDVIAKLKQAETIKEEYELKRAKLDKLTAELA